MPVFFRHVKQLVQERGDVNGVDLGCGSGRYARKLAGMGCTVTAVDRKLMWNETQDKDVSWREQSPVYWHAGLRDDEYFDFVLARNILHFLPQPWVIRTLLPDLNRRIQPGGIIAIATFYREPEPRLAKEVLSLYRLSQLREVFENWDPVRMMEWPHYGQGLFDTEQRQWYSTLLIMQKPDE